MELLKLEPGHYRSVIKLMADGIEDQRKDLVVHVENKDFEKALKCAIEIREVEFWIGFFEEEIESIND